MVHKFVEFVRMKSVPTPIIYQDSTSVISLITKGGGITRTKHLMARVHLGKEAYESGSILVKYKGTKEIKADGLSKPFDPEEHCRFPKVHTRWKKVLQRVSI
jgi:hypothetical protein